jgi:hypothetical protein
MDEVRYLVAQIEKLRPFPEVPEALARVPLPPYRTFQR